VARSIYLHRIEAEHSKTERGQQFDLRIPSNAGWRRCTGDLGTAERACKRLDALTSPLAAIYPASVKDISEAR